MIRRDVVQVQRYKEILDKVKQRERVPDGERIEVKCNTYPADALLIETYGLQSRVTKLIHADEWPGDAFNRVYFDDAEWEQVAPAEHFNKTTRPHWTVLVKKRG